MADFFVAVADIEATEGRKCLCNGLMANAGLPQARMPRFLLFRDAAMHERGSIADSE